MQPTHTLKVTEFADYLKGENERALRHLRAVLQPLSLTPEQEYAVAFIETNLAIALRVYAKTNPSKLRAAAQAAGISFFMSDLESK